MKRKTDPRLRNAAKSFLTAVGALGALFLLYVGGVLAFGAWTTYVPPDQAPAEAVRKGGTASLADSTLSFMIWNIGYAGLGAEVEFFYEHSSLVSSGRTIRAEKDISQAYFREIEQFIAAQKVDFFLLQEIDRPSRRSHSTDQVAALANRLPGFAADFFVNYQVCWVPVPLLEPWHAYGQVSSGLATYSRVQPTSSVRYQLPGQFAWPSRMFMLDRCIGVSRFSLANGNELVVVNVHNEAYDQGGKIKRQQLAFLRQLLEKEYAKGNYIVAGGDWNQSPPFFKPESLQPAFTRFSEQIPLDPDFMPPTWRWVYDPGHPTNRSIKEPYQKGETEVALIDFFLISPNIRVHRVKTLDQQFRASDHQPVWMEVRLIR
ncbi:MAG: endonuclease/exonuclease/phosphatase family protein [Haliscomenobacter sp.]|nr:endonuclease/exonuclease/phosphatase family protein [Haliscomenobacter sp.]